MYVNKMLGVCWGLVDKISPAFELIEKLRVCVLCWHSASSDHSSYLVHPKDVPSSIEGVSGRQMGPNWSSEDSPPVNRQSPPSPVPPGQSPADTYLKQHLQPLQIFNQKI
jgi:hypothetical protein